MKKVLIPIKAIEERTNNLEYRKQRTLTNYPLYETYKIKELYNFNNLSESLYKWDNYSNRLDSNIKKVVDILSVVQENGSIDDKNNALRIVNDYIISSLPNPNMYKSYFNKLEESFSEPIKEKIAEQVDCDRVVGNYNTIMKRFNIDKIVANSILENTGVTDIVYSLCELIDTYNMGLKQKFCVCTESCLYAINRYTSQLPEKAILENVIDYFIINYGTTNTDSFIEDISCAIKNDNFISPIAEEYINYIDSVYKKMNNQEPDYDKEVLNRYKDDSVYGMSKSFDDFAVMNKSLQAIYEVAILDKAKELITKIKIAPYKTVSMVKEAIRAVFVINRLQDIAQGTHNALAIAFYALVTLGAFSVGIFPGILSFITSIILHSHLNKEYLKDSIREWKEHKRSIERKIEDTKDSERKSKLLAYLDSVNNSIELLEKEYDKQRDKTTDELNDEIKRRIDSPDFSSISNQSYVNPVGEKVPTVLDKFKQVADKSERKEE